MPWSPDVGKATRFQKGDGRIRGFGSLKVDDPDNPGQRVSFMKLAQRKSVSALFTLVEIHQDPKMPPAVRIRAAETILERAFGRAPQALEVENTGAGPVALQVVFGEPPAADAPPDTGSGVTLEHDGPATGEGER